MIGVTRRADLSRGARPRADHRPAWPSTSPWCPTSGGPTSASRAAGSSASSTATPAWSTRRWPGSGAEGRPGGPPRRRRRELTVGDDGRPGSRASTTTWQAPEPSVDDPTEELLAANRRNWDEPVPLHLASALLRRRRVAEDTPRSAARPREVHALLGTYRPRPGPPPVPLRQGHPGLGPGRCTVTGLDFSEAAIAPPDGPGRTGGAGRTGPTSCAQPSTRRRAAARRTDLRHRLRQSRCPVLAPEHRRVGGAGGRAPPARAVGCSSTRPTRSAWSLADDDLTLVYTLLRGGRPPTPTIRGRQLRRRRTEPFRATPPMGGTTAWARSSAPSSVGACASTGSTSTTGPVPAVPLAGRGRRGGVRVPDGPAPDAALVHPGGHPALRFARRGQAVRLSRWGRRGSGRSNRRRTPCGARRRGSPRGRRTGDARSLPPGTSRASPRVRWSA